ncbi:hypothetical protein ACFQER_11650 [Halomicroarcula sp. GCM10025894]
MERSLLGMLAVFVLTFVTGVAGLLVLPGAGYRCSRRSPASPASASV